MEADSTNTPIRSLTETIFVLFLRVVALSCLWFGLQYWALLVGYSHDGLGRFDLLSTPWRVAATALAVVFPVAALGLCILAVGAGVPWNRLILVWIAGSTAKGVPFTPGGIGFVEGAIALALVGSGLSPATATAAALLYRFVSFWMLLGIGWVVVAVRRFRVRGGYSGADLSTKT